MSSVVHIHITGADNGRKRKWVYALPPSGRFYTMRNVVSYVCIALLFLMPFIKIDGAPMFMFNVLEFKIILFGKVFWPQHFHVLAMSMVLAFVFVAIFTLVYGRLFCGWVCPQTVFMEFVFRRIEWLIEGSPSRQKKINQSPWTATKVFKKGLKHLVFFVLSFLIANIFFSYVIGADSLYKKIQQPISENGLTLLGIAIFSLLFYLVFTFVRDIVCTTICPYGRLQGVLMNKDSVQILYDYKRGDPRGHLKKGNQAASVGDCIDCSKCVQVCPTGIDIRNGSQMECVGCTACADACDEVMDKVKRPRGLIRYASENEIEQGVKWTFGTRAKWLSIGLCALAVLLLGFIYKQRAVDSYVSRIGGQLYHELPGGVISNIFNVKIINTTAKGLAVQLQLEDIKGVVRVIGHNKLLLKRESIAEYIISVEIPADALTKRNTSISIGVYKGKQPIQTLKTSFYKPI